MIYYQWTIRSPAVSRTRNPFALGASPDVSSANLGTESEQRPGDSLGSRRHSGVGEKGKKVSAWNEWERGMGGRGEAWWKATRVLKEDITKQERRVGLRQTRRCVSLAAFTQPNTDMWSNQTHISRSFVRAAHTCAAYGLDAYRR